MKTIFKAALVLSGFGLLASCSGTHADAPPAGTVNGNVVLSSSQSMPVHTMVGQPVSWSYTVSNNTNADVNALNLQLSPGPVTVTNSVSTAHGLRASASLPACGSTLAAGHSCSLTLTYNPQNTTPITQTLSGQYSANGHIGLFTTPAEENIVVDASPATSPLTMTADTTTLVTTIGNTVEAKLTVSNNSLNSMTGLTLNGANSGDFSLNTNATSCGNTLAANASCIYELTYTPTQPDSATATLLLTANQMKEAVSLTIKANVDYGTASMPSTATTTSPINTQASTFLLTVTPETAAVPHTPLQKNPSTYPIQMQSIFDGGSNDFGNITFAGGAFPGTGGTCSATLSQTGPCQVALTFTPSSSANGLSTFNLTFHFSSGPDHTTFTQAVAVTASIAPIGVSVDSSNPTCSIANQENLSTGGVTCVYDATNLSNQADTVNLSNAGLVAPLSMSSDNCTAQGSLQPGKSCKFAVTYNPTTQMATSPNGTQNLSIVYHTGNSPELSPMTYSLKNTTLVLVAPAETVALLNPGFGVIDFQVSASNNNYALSLPTITASNNDPAGTTYSIDPHNTCNTISSTPCTLLVDVHFNPALTQGAALNPVFSYTETYGSQAPTTETTSVPVSVTLPAAGSVSWASNSPVSLVTNQGTPSNVAIFTLNVGGDADVTNVTINGGCKSGAPFSLDTSTNCSTGANAGKSCEIHVIYTPQTTADDGKSCQLSGTYTANGITSHLPAAPTLTGFITPATLTITPDYHLYTVSSVNNLLSPVAQATGLTSVMPDTLFSEPGQTMYMRVAVTEAGSNVYADQHPATLTVSFPAGNTAFSVATTNLPTDACPAGAITTVPCYLYLEYNTPNAFSTSPVTTAVTVSEQSGSDPSQPSPAVLPIKTSTDVLYTLTDQGLLALSPEDGELVNQHVLPALPTLATNNLAASAFSSVAIDPATQQYYLGVAATNLSVMGYYSCDLSGTASDCHWHYFNALEAASVAHKFKDESSSVTYYEKLSFGEQSSQPYLYLATNAITSSNQGSQVATVEILNPASTAAPDASIMNPSFMFSAVTPANATDLGVVYNDGTNNDYGVYNPMTTTMTTVNTGINNPANTEQLIGVGVNSGASDSNQILIASTNGVAASSATNPNFTVYSGTQCFDAAVAADGSAGNVYLTSGFACGNTSTSILVGAFAGSSVPSTSMNLSGLTTPNVTEIYDLKLVQHGAVIG